MYCYKVNVHPLVLLLIYGSVFLQSVLSRPDEFQREQSCQEREYLACQDAIGFNVTATIGEYIRAETLPAEAFLDEHCEKIVKMIKCLTQNAETCDPGTYIRHIAIIVKELCDNDSELRRAYNANVQCINDNLDNIRKCDQRSWEFAAAQFENDNLSDDEHRERFCLSLYVSEEKCILGIPAEKCDDSLYDIGKRLKNMMELGNQMCSEHMRAIGNKYGSKVESWNWSEEK